MGKFILLVLCFLVTLPIVSYSAPLANTTTQLDLNDVSILLPLPPTEQWNLLPQGSTNAQFGVLLSLENFQKLPQILGLASNEQIYDIVKVIGIRLDPCFAEGFSPTDCQPQIRMIWQPLAEGEESTTSFDAAIHTFYNLTKPEFKELVLQLRELKSTRAPISESLPLGINPYLKQDGLNSLFAKHFFEIIYRYTGEARLSRITFMQLFLNGNIWQFGGFDITRDHKSAALFNPIKIPRLGVNLQQFRNNAKPEPTWFSGGFSPELPTETQDNLSYLIQDSRIISPQLNEAEITQAVRASFKIENPSLHNPGTVDCASCHIAQAASLWATRSYPWLNLVGKNTDIIYTNERNLSNLSPLQNQNNILRAFGYFLDAPITSQRTINETAEVVRQISEAY